MSLCRLDPKEIHYHVSICLWSNLSNFCISAKKKFPSLLINCSCSLFQLNISSSFSRHNMNLRIVDYSEITSLKQYVDPQLCTDSPWKRDNSQTRSEFTNSAGHISKCVKYKVPLLARDDSVELESSCTHILAVNLLKETGNTYWYLRLLLKELKSGKKKLERIKGREKNYHVKLWKRNEGARRFWAFLLSRDQKFYYFSWWSLLVRQKIREMKNFTSVRCQDELFNVDQCCDNIDFPLAL